MANILWCFRAFTIYSPSQRKTLKTPSTSSLFSPQKKFPLDTARPLCYTMFIG